MVLPPLLPLSAAATTSAAVSSTTSTSCSTLGALASFISGHSRWRLLTSHYRHLGGRFAVNQNIAETLVVVALC